MSLKDVTLWSFLTQSSAKQEIVCPKDLRVTIEEFAEELTYQLNDNQLPASAELTLVNWDDTNTKQKLILVRYTDNQASTNVLQFAVALEQLGRFAYVEKKVYLNPPQLPSKLESRSPIQYIPQEKDEIENELRDGRNGSSILAVIGVIIMFLGLRIFAFGEVSSFIIGSFFLGIAILLFIISRSIKSENPKTQEIKNRYIKINQQNQKIRQENTEIEQWNQQKQERDQKRQQLLECWFSDTLTVAYLSKANDVFGRWTSAVSTTIDQVVQKLFIDRNAQAKQWQEEQRSQEEIEKELERRNAELFG